MIIRSEVKMTKVDSIYLYSKSTKNQLTFLRRYATKLAENHSEELFKN